MVVKRLRHLACCIGGSEESPWVHSSDSSDVRAWPPSARIECACAYECEGKTPSKRPLGERAWCVACLTQGGFGRTGRDGIIGGGDTRWLGRRGKGKAVRVAETFFLFVLLAFPTFKSCDCGCTDKMGRDGGGADSDRRLACNGAWAFRWCHSRVV